MGHCPNPECNNKQHLPTKWPSEFYVKHSRIPNGGQRYKCKVCGITFAKKAEKPSSSLLKDRTILRLLISGRSVNDICMETDSTPENVNKLICNYSEKARDYEGRILLGESLTMSLDMRLLKMENYLF